MMNPVMGRMNIRSKLVLYLTIQMMTTIWISSETEDEEGAAGAEVEAAVGEA
jgi:hypothetical protein